MIKSRKVDEYGGQTGNEEKSEDVVVTEEKIIGDDGVERTIIKKTTTRRTIQTQHVTQGAKVTTVKRSVVTSDGRAIDLPDEFQQFSIENQSGDKKSNQDKKSSKHDDEEEGIKGRIKSLFGGSKKSPKSDVPAIKAPPSGSGSSQSSSGSKSKDEPSSKATDDDKEFAEECLKWHNFYRQKHGVKPLKLSAELTKYAKEWAQQIAKRDVMEHRPHNVYGENIFMKWSGDPKFMIAGRDPVDNWYHEIKDHVFGKEPTSLKSGHFTQVVWKESEELGVAKAKSPSGKILVVANYNPAGNVLGHFATNVPPPKN